MNFSFAREDYCVCEHVWGLQFAAENQNSTVDSSEIAFSAIDIDFLENLANGNAENLPPTPWFEQMKMIVSYGTLIIGLPANILILFITAFNWRTKSSSSWLVLNLAVADLCLVVSAFLTILKASKYNRTIDGDVRFPQLQCKFDFGCPHFFACVSFFSISAIAFDRFYAIVRAGVGDNPGFRYSMIFGTVWTLSLLLTFPMLYFANAIENNDEYTCIVAWTMQSRDQCVVMGSNKSYNKKELLTMPEASMIECPENNSTLGRCEQPKYFLEKIYYGTFTVVGFIVPMIVIITSYYFIMQKVHKSRIQIKKIGTKNDGADSRKNFNRTIMIFFVATLICLLPYICYQIILFYMIPLSSYHCEGFKNVSQSFLIMSPILNAILYSFLGRKFREECFSTFTRIFGFRGRSQRNPTLATDSTAFSGRHSGSRFSRSYPKQESTRISTSVRAMSSSCQEQS